VRNLASCSTSVIFERPAFESAARYLNSETNPVSRDDGQMSSPGLVQFVPRTSEIISWKRDPLKNFTLSITLQRIVRVCSNCTQSLITWRPNDHKNSRSRGQRSRLAWHDVLKYDENAKYMTKKIVTFHERTVWLSINFV